MEVAPLPGGLGRTATRLGEALGRAARASADSLAAESAHIPPVYAALVAGGHRSGRLPAALEVDGRHRRAAGEARGAIGLAVCSIAWRWCCSPMGYYLMAVTTLSSRAQVMRTRPWPSRQASY